MSTGPPPSPPSPPAYAQGSKDDSWRTPVQPGAPQHYRKKATQAQAQALQAQAQALQAQAGTSAQHQAAMATWMASLQQAGAAGAAGAAGGAAGGL